MGFGQNEIFDDVLNRQSIRILTSSKRGHNYSKERSSEV